MVIGGIIISDDDLQKFNDTMGKYRKEMNMHSELKWSKVTNQKYTEYQRFVDYFFALNNNDIVHFRSMIIDTHQLNHHKFNSGDKELGFYKFHYQLFLHCFAKPYCIDDDGTRFIIHPDKRNSKYPLNELITILNNGYNKHVRKIINPFVAIEPVDSKNSEVVQINDIILGAIGFQKNGVDLLADTRQSKIDLSNYISEKAGLKNLMNTTAYQRNRFTIWNFKLKK